MATPPLFNSKVTTFSSDKTCGLSKSQICLKKIIDIISSGSSSIQPCEILRKSSENKISNEKEYSNDKVRDLFIEKRGVVGIDLNLKLGFLPLDTRELENLTVDKGFSACSGVGDEDGDGDRINIDCNSSVVSDDEIFTKSSEGECDPIEVPNSMEDFPATIEDEVIEEERRNFSDITNQLEMETEDKEQSEIKDGEEEDRENEVEDRKNQKDLKQIERYSWSRENQKDGYLDLLVEAARLISGNFRDDDEEEKQNRSRNKQLSIESEEETDQIIPSKKSSKSKEEKCWKFDIYEDFEDISPIVRSKRGRNQVLPLKYRDSVLDPWKRLTKQKSLSRVSSRK